jgi:antirestriction protein
MNNKERTFDDFTKEFDTLENNGHLEGFLHTEGVIKYLKASPIYQEAFMRWIGQKSVEEFSLSDFDQIPADFLIEYYSEEEEAWLLGDMEIHEQYAEGKLLAEVR